MSEIEADIQDFFDMFEADMVEDPEGFYMVDLGMLEAIEQFIIEITEEKSECVEER